MTSKAQRWYEAQEAVQRSFKVCDGLTANIILIPNSGPHLELVRETVSLEPTADQALAFARWIIVELEEGEGKG